MDGRFIPRFLYFCSLFFVALLAFAGNAAAQQPVSTTDAHGCGALSAGFLNEKLAFWQPRLDLQAWKISVVLSHASDLKPKTLGNIHWDAKSKTAVIRVLNASEYQLPCPGMLADMEDTLVHELVHLELSSLPRSLASRREEEHAVNRITDALLALERRSDAPAADLATR
jgi:hypothetical protein